MARHDTLYVSDLDGTLLGADSRVSEQSREIITELSGAGYQITVATARTPATVVPLLAGTLTLPPAITMTGAALWARQPAPGHYQNCRFFSPQESAGVLAALDACGLKPFIYTLPAESTVLEVYNSSRELSRPQESFVDQRRNLPLKRFHLGRNAPAELLNGRVLLFLVLGPIEPVMAAAAELRSSGQGEVSAYPDNFNPRLGILEILAPGVSKASAVQTLAAELGLPRIVAFGDNLNDLPMFDVATEGVAVGNAQPQVLERADHIIASNTSPAAVARFILED